MNTPYSFARQRHKPAFATKAQPRFDVASFVHVGARDYQQDAVVTNFPKGDDIGVAVLADGMGGHLGGEVASNAALSVAFAEMKLQLVHVRAGHMSIPQALGVAVDRANYAIAEHVHAHPQLAGMGTTLVICVIAGSQLYWASVGDSPLYLFRDGTMTRLNEDHSMGPQIDAMVQSGIINAADAADHPQRNQLLSAVCGGDLTHLDCPDSSFALTSGDVLLLASDGIQTLSDEKIGHLLRKKHRTDSDQIVDALMQAVLDEGEETQDNVSIIATKLIRDDPIALPTAPNPAPPVATAATSPTAEGDDTDVEQASDLLNKALLL
ncbi:MAG: protein phosphatase 2C domain-containing protein [Pseudomonadota bacterium]